MTRAQQYRAEHGQTAEPGRHERGTSHVPGEDEQIRVDPMDDREPDPAAIPAAKATVRHVMRSLRRTERGETGA